jgi:predicted RNA-binding Zn-ribbon protein involved in translation (DUF1610 family)
MSDAAESEVERLTDEVQRLRETVERQSEVINLLAANADIEPLEGWATCPECGEGDLAKRSGISWSKLACPACGTQWNL